MVVSLPAFALWHTINMAGVYPASGLMSAGVDSSTYFGTLVGFFFTSSVCKYLFNFIARLALCHFLKIFSIN